MSNLVTGCIWNRGKGWKFGRECDEQRVMRFLRELWLKPWFWVLVKVFLEVSISCVGARFHKITVNLNHDLDFNQSGLDRSASCVEAVLNRISDNSFDAELASKRVIGLSGRIWLVKHVSTIYIWIHNSKNNSQRWTCCFIIDCYFFSAKVTQGNFYMYLSPIAIIADQANQCLQEHSDYHQVHDHHVHPHVQQNSHHQIQQNKEPTKPDIANHFYPSNFFLRF